MSSYSFDDIVSEFKMRSEESFRKYQDMKKKREEEFYNLQKEASHLFDRRRDKKKRQLEGKPATIEGYKEDILEMLSEGMSLYQISNEINYSVKAVNDYVHKLPEYINKYSKKRVV